MSEQKHSTHVTETPDTSHIKNVDVTHEASDVQVGSIAKFVVALLVLTIATHIALWGMFRLLDAAEAKKETPRAPMAMTEEERLPPEPRLQSAPKFAEGLEQVTPKDHAEEGAARAATESNTPKDPLWEIKVLNERWHDALEHGPIDEHGKRFGMPIDKAKEEVLKQGLPVRTQAPDSRKQ
jgi:hypothetical protein